MKRFLFYLFIYLFVYFFISSFTPPVQADCSANYDLYGNVASCTNNGGCSRCIKNLDFCGCVAIPPTSTPVPPPPPPTCSNAGGQCLSAFCCAGLLCNGSTCYAPSPTPIPIVNNCTGNPNNPNCTAPNGICCTSPSFGVCNQNTNIWTWNCTTTTTCTDSDFSPWSPNPCTAGSIQTRYCTNPTCCQSKTNAQWCATGGGPTPTGAPVPTNTPTPTSTPTNTPTPTPTPTISPGPWIKLKNSSFISVNNLSNNVPVAPVAYDVDDTTQAYFIVGTAGLVAAPIINITRLNSSAKTSNPEFKITYTPNLYSFTPTSYLAYINARKQHTVLTNPNLSEVTGSGIYTYTGDLTINSNSAPFNHVPAYNIVLIATGTITINQAPDNTFSPTGSVAIVAPNIIFNSSVIQASGIFIANSLDTGTTVNQGLKIIGNLVAKTSLTNGRNWSNLNIPVLFIVYKLRKSLRLPKFCSCAFTKMKVA